MQRLGAAVIGVSADNVESHVAWAAELGGTVAFGAGLVGWVLRGGFEQFLAKDVG